MNTLVQIAPQPLRVIKSHKTDDGTDVVTVGGDLVVFSDANSTDLEGDYFDAKTHFGALSITGTTTVASYYQHGFDKHYQGTPLGIATLTLREASVWAEHQIALRSDYEKHLLGLIEAGKMGQSSGAVSHLVSGDASGKGFYLKAWPIGEASITPTPAEPRTSVMPIKSLALNWDEIAWQAGEAWHQQRMQQMLVKGEGEQLQAIAKALDGFNTELEIALGLSRGAKAFQLTA